MSLQLFSLKCGAQNYDWGKPGSTLAVARYALINEGVTIDATKPYAELWMGTHPLVPSITPLGKTLRETVAANPGLLGTKVVERFGAGELPFLFKVLSIEKVLSIQAHPDKKLAAQLHARDPAHYPDDNHKPEMAVAVTDFEGFCGFKPLLEIKESIEKVAPFKTLVGSAGEAFVAGVSEDVAENKKLLEAVFEQVMRASKETIEELAAQLVELATASPELFFKDQASLILRLNKQFPNDVGLFCGCILLNHCVLQAGEAMFLEAKDPHAYISGDIIECMAASDNVVRAGFTPKFIDVSTLVSMLTYRYGGVEAQKMETPVFGRATGGEAALYDPPIDEFSVVRSQVEGEQKHAPVDGPSIIIVTEGTGSIAGDGVEEAVVPGSVYFVGAGLPITLKGSLTAYRAFVEA